MKIDRNLLLSLLLPMLWLAALRVFSFSGGENCCDAYYHVAMADAGPGAILSKSFPAMTMSVWENSFSDKEALFHLSLGALRWIQRLAGFETGPPFHFPGLAFDFLLVACFVFSLRALGVRDTWLPALALVMMSPFFTNRILMLRPHVLSIALILASLPVFACAKGRKGALLSFALGALYSWSYSNPHFLLLPAACLFAARLPEDGFKKAAMPGFFAGLGVLAAQIVHPQFPNTVVNWKIQCVDVVMHALRPEAYPIRSPAELTPPDGVWAFWNLLLYALFAFNLSLALAVRAKGSIRSFSPAAQGVFACSAIAVAGTLFGIRALEYGLPLSIMAAALMVKELPSLPSIPKGFSFSRAAKLELLAVLLLAAMAGAWIQLSIRDMMVKPPTAFASWMRSSGIKPGSTIANLSWSDFTVLYYSLPDYRYLCGLDPMFAFERFPERFTKIERFRTLDAWLPPASLAEASGASCAYVGPLEEILAGSMKARGYKTLYKGRDGWLFELK